MVNGVLDQRHMVPLRDHAAGAAAAAFRGLPLPHGFPRDTENASNGADTTKSAYDRICGFLSHSRDCYRNRNICQEADVGKQATDEAMPPESHKPRNYGWDGMDETIAWLRSKMEQHGINQVGIAKLIGKDRQTVNKVLAGTRRIASDELLKLQEHFRTLEYGAVGSSTELASGGEVSVNPNPLPSVRYIRVVGEVAAGLWREVTYSDFEHFDLPIVADPRWPAEALSALVVRGQSINRKANDGDFVLILDIHHAPRSFREDDWVVVERREGDKVETTVKRVGRNGDGGWLLLPDSTDPRWQEPIHLVENGNEDVEVRVVAFVLDFIKPATKL